MTSSFLLRGQIVDQSTTLLFSKPKDTVVVQMGGLLDANNTFTYPNKRAFQHMKKVIVSNMSDEIVINPRLLINFKKNWFDIGSLRNEVFEGAKSSEERALSLWKFMRDNRLHYNEPDIGKEIDDPIKLLGIYGYGMCYNTSYASAFLASRYPYKQIPYREYSPRNRHSVKDILFDSTFFLIDSDIEVFYRTLDNTSIARYDDLANDKHLIRRVHHYGKAEIFNKYNTFVANAVYEPGPPVNFTGIYRDIDFHTLDFRLRPGESIIYDWAPAKYYHHNFWWTHNAPLTDIGNGKLVFSTDFKNAPLDLIFESYDGLDVSLDDEAPNIHPNAPNNMGVFILKNVSSFVIVNASVDVHFYKETELDQIKMYFSKDSTSWELVWDDNEVGSGNFNADLYDLIQPIGHDATYKYYLKFELHSANSHISCGIDSIRTETVFQVSRSFLPSLQLGENHISYSDSNEGDRKVEVILEWQESTENSPPPPVISPIFPADGFVVDSLKFCFKWTPVSDSDGIVDYEFLLSDRPDMKFPLTPSFEVYTSSIPTQSELSSFKIPYDGLLNPKNTYYWKVRAKDSKGAWSEWSQVWSFSVEGPLPPIPKPPIVSMNTIELSWESNPNGKIPTYFEIHASDLAEGFTPSDKTLYKTTTLTSERLSLEFGAPKTFYRIVAVDENGARSGPSKVCSIPYPFVYQPLDSIRPNKIYSFELRTNSANTTDGQVLFGEYINYDIVDPVEVKVLSKPNWLEYQSENKRMYGVPNYQQAHLDSVVVQFLGQKTQRETIQVFKFPVRLNAPPAPLDITFNAHIDSIFEQTISLIDPDIKEGDRIMKVEVLQKPTWVNFSWDSLLNKLHLKGIPSKEDHGSTLLVVRVYDAIGTSSESRIQINSNASATLDGDASVCPAAEAIVTVSCNGRPPWRFTISDGTDTLTVEDIRESSYAIRLSPIVDTEYRLISVSNETFDPIGIRSNTHTIKVKATTIEGISESIATVGELYRGKIIVNGENLCSDSLRFRIIAGPSWMSVDELSGELNGVPTGMDEGPNTFIIQVINRFGYEVEGVLNLLVNRNSHLLGSSPNPFLRTTHLQIRVSEQSNLNLTITTPRGRIVFNQEMLNVVPDVHFLEWDSDGNAGGFYFVTLRVQGQSGKVRVERIKLLKVE